MTEISPAVMLGLSLFVQHEHALKGVSPAQRKIQVDLHFIVRLRHKASGTALGPSCAVWF